MSHRRCPHFRILSVFDASSRKSLVGNSSELSIRDAQGACRPEVLGRGRQPSAPLLSSRGIDGRGPYGEKTI